MMVWFLVVVPGAAVLSGVGYHLGYRRPAFVDDRPPVALAPARAPAPAGIAARAPAAPVLATESGPAEEPADRWDQLAAELDEATRWGWLVDVGWIAFVLVLLLVALRLAT